MITAKYGIIPSVLFPDSSSAASTSSMNDIIASKLRSYALQLRQTPASGIPRRRKEMMQDIYRTLTIAYRVPPRPDEPLTWEYYDKDGEYRQWKGTPLSFLAEHKEGEYFSPVNDPRFEYETLQAFPYGSCMVGGKAPLRKCTTPIHL